MRPFRHRIDSSTRLCGVIGDPINHSLSPIMHNAAFQATDLNYVLLAFRVKKENLRKAVEGLRSMNILGCSVTIPHKVDISKLLDNVQDEARKIGAVNSIINKEGKLTGLNTDVEGVIKPLMKKGFNGTKKEALLIGAGGAARAFILAFDRLGLSRVKVFNRTLSRAEKMIDEIGNGLKLKIDLIDITKENVLEAAASSSLIANATSVGMSGTEIIIPREIFNKNVYFFEVVITPVNTPLLEIAKSCGATVIHGYEMLVAQGESSFKIWTGIEPPKGVMENAILNKLGVVN